MPPKITLKKKTNSTTPSNEQPTLTQKTSDEMPKTLADNESKSVNVIKLIPNTTIKPKLATKPKLAIKTKLAVNNQSSTTNINTIDEPDDLQKFLYNGIEYCLSESNDCRIFIYNRKLEQYDEVGRICTNANPNGKQESVMFIDNKPISPKAIKIL